MMDSKIIAIISIVTGLASTLLGWLIGRAVWGGRLENRVEKCEGDIKKLSDTVTHPQCTERMEAIKSNSSLQFNYAAERQIEIKKLLQEQNEAVFLLNEQNEKRLAKVQELAEERFDRLVGLLVKNIEKQP